MENIGISMQNIGKIKECIGCGFCCQTPCGAGARLYPGAKPCPALKWNGERHVCDLMTLPGSLGPEYRKELYAGEGCCSNLNSWRKEPLQDRTKKEEPIMETLPETFQIFLHCLGREFISPDALFMANLSMIGELQKKGYTEEKCKTISKLILHYLKGEESSFKQSFMGSL
jgi:hypothetical protein